LKELADQFAMSDNYHQAVNGGTGVNHIVLGHGDLIWYSDGAGHPLTPPHDVTVAAGTRTKARSTRSRTRIPRRNRQLVRRGRIRRRLRRQTFVRRRLLHQLRRSAQPGVAAIVKYLQSLPRPIDPHCEAGHYYLLNNYNPGYFGDGRNAFTDSNPHNTVFTVPPTSTRSIADALLAKRISWKYYGD